MMPNAAAKPSPVATSPAAVPLPARIPPRSCVGSQGRQRLARFDGEAIQPLDDVVDDDEFRCARGRETAPAARLPFIVEESTPFHHVQQMPKPG